MVKLEVTGVKDFHSGVDGGVLPEPLADLVRLLGHLIGTDEKCLIPGFYDKVRQITKDEHALYDDVSDMMPALEVSRKGQPNLVNFKYKDKKESTLARWHFPTISFHGIQVSGLGTSTIIPAFVPLLSF